LSFSAQANYKRAVLADTLEAVKIMKAGCIRINKPHSNFRVFSENLKADETINGAFASCPHFLPQSDSQLPGIYRMRLISNSLAKNAEDP
jgi:hypothetical protein